MASTNEPQLAATERRYVNVRQLAEMLGISHVTLELWRRKGTGPAHLRVGRRVVYDIVDVRAWLDANRRGGAELAARSAR